VAKRSVLIVYELGYKLRL